MAAQLTPGAVSRLVAGLTGEPVTLQVMGEQGGRRSPTSTAAGRPGGSGAASRPCPHSPPAWSPLHRHTRTPATRLCVSPLAPLPLPACRHQAPAECAGSAGPLPGAAERRRVQPLVHAGHPAGRPGALQRPQGGQHRHPARLHLQPSAEQEVSEAARGGLRAWWAGWWVGAAISFCNSAPAHLDGCPSLLAHLTSPFALPFCPPLLPSPFALPACPPLLPSPPALPACPPRLPAGW